MYLKDDFKRYKYLVVLHTICTVAFGIRFIILCTDLSAAKGTVTVYPVIILLLELGSSLITLIANLIYVFLRYLGPILFESDREKVGCCSQRFAWSLSTLTCIRCRCHEEHPQMISLNRFFILVSFELMRFIAFILACVCANRYGPVGLGYAIVAGLTLPFALFLLVVEYLHHHRLWFHYRPDTSSEEKRPYLDKHRGFLPLIFANDQQTSHWQDSLCEKGDACMSRNLYHVIMYHSGNRRYPSDQTGDYQTVVGFHQTHHVAAYMIAEKDFMHSKQGWIGPGTYFATALSHTEFKANNFGAYFCAKVNLGKTKRVTNPNAWCDSLEKFDTIYYEHPNQTDEFCVQNLKQISNWIILIDQEPNEQLLKERNNKPLPSGKYIEDRLEDVVYQGCVF